MHIQGSSRAAAPAANTSLLLPGASSIPAPVRRGAGVQRQAAVWDRGDKYAAEDKFSSCSVASRPECSRCWAKLYCAGGCAANAFHSSGDITGTYEYGCRLFKKRIECAIMMQVARAFG